MPIRLSWTPPVLQGSGIIGYKIYKTLSPGPLVHSHTHLLQIVEGDVTLYDDYDYDRRLLESVGYLYKVTALTGDVEGSFAAADTMLVQYSFEDFVLLEPWDLTLSGDDILELEESWDINVYSYTSLGNIPTGGTAPLVLTYVVLGTGDLVLDSFADVLFTKYFIGSGDMAINGSETTILFTKDFVGAGGMSLDGTADSEVGDSVLVLTWTDRTPPPSGDTWFDVGWSASLGRYIATTYVATGANDLISSSDGVNWIGVNSSHASQRTCITWSPELGIFVSIANIASNQIITSSDGTTWTVRTSAVNLPWSGVTWSAGLGLFVAVAFSDATNGVMTSPDGTNWTSRTKPSESYGAVIWVAELGLFVAVGSLGAAFGRVMTSPDGITWTKRTAAQQNPWCSITWSPALNLLVAVCDADGFTGNTHRVMTSPDGITWISHAAPLYTWREVVWVAEYERFVAVAQDLGGSMTSPDGLTWTFVATPVHAWFDIVWSPELQQLVAIGESAIMTGEFGFV